MWERSQSEQFDLVRIAVLNGRLACWLILISSNMQARYLSGGAQQYVMPTPVVYFWPAPLWMPYINLSEVPETVSESQVTIQHTIIISPEATYDPPTDQ